MRLVGQRKMGYYPTPPLVVERLKSFIAFPEENVTCLDPCCGEGEALSLLVQGRKAVTYGVELDKGRAEKTQRVLHHTLHADYQEARITQGAFSLLFLNPPYDWEEGDFKEDSPSERKELTFLRNTIKYLQAGGLLLYIIPEARLDERVAGVLAYRFQDLSVYRFPEEVYEPFHQICVLGVRKKNPVRDREAVAALIAARGRFPELPKAGKPRYALPPKRPVSLFRSSKVDQRELAAEVAQSPLWKQLKSSGSGGLSGLPSPPLPLHTGHLGLLMAAGYLDGAVGEGRERHVVAGRVEKLTLQTEEVREDGTLENRELDRFRVTIRLLFPNGEIRTLT